MTRARLKFNLNEICELAGRYKFGLDDKELQDLKPTVLGRGHLTLTDLKKVVYWKSPRTSGHAARNDEEFVEEVTRFALAAKSERARVESLTLLNGVSYPTATVILHFFHTDPYPILDFRALWSVSLDVPNQYGFAFWWPYVEFCRKIAAQAGADMRTLDQALWQYSNENQRPA